MLKNIFAAFIFFFYVPTVFAQTVKRNTQNSPDNYQQLPIEHSIKPFFVIQGTVSKFFRDMDVSFGTSASLGIKYLNKFGLSVNAQLYGLDYGVIEYVPVSMEFSYTADKHFLRPFANLQIGHNFSNSDYSYLAGDQNISSKTRGTIFFSPGVGVLIPVKKQSGILLTLSYVRTGYASAITVTNPASNVTSYSRDNFSGYRFGVGFKF